MLIQATQLRPGMILEYNNGLWRVMAISHITPGNWRGMVQTKLRNVKTGTQTENRFRSEDRVERIILSQIEDGIPLSGRRRFPFHEHRDL